MKKMMALLCALALCCAMLPAGALAAQEVVNVYNWFDYMDPEVFEMFEAETGIHVNTYYFEKNEDMMVQLEYNPGAYDLVFPSDYCVERMISKGMLAEINFDNIPNIQYIDPLLIDPQDAENTDYDPENKYSVPFMWGTLGILYNTTMVDDEVDSWEILWNEKYAGKIYMLDSIRDTMGMALKSLGYSMNSTDRNELRAASDKLIAQKPLVKAYYVDETKEKMAAGQAALALMWSGDALYAMDLNEDLAYVVPKEGSNIWVDPMVIPVNAQNKENAEKLINFLCDPEIAQMNCEFIWYSSPNIGAIELMGEDYTDNPTINPDDGVRGRCEYFHDLSEDDLRLFNYEWERVKNAR